MLQGSESAFNADPDFIFDLDKDAKTFHYFSRYVIQMLVDFLMK